MADRDRFLVFLADSLALWGVAGSVEAGTAPVVAQVVVENGTLVWIERPTETESTFRWYVRWRPAGEAPGCARERRPRPCTSVVGLLNALRAAAGVDRGGRVRIVPVLPGVGDG